MHEQKNFRCPLCNQRFTPEDGVTAEEHIAGGIIKTYRDLQNASLLYPLPCPRCGRMRMLRELEDNAISRHTDIYICPECGANEALRQAGDNVLTLIAWYAVSELLKAVPGVRCEDYIPEKHNPYPLCDNPACGKSRECNISLHMVEENIL